MLRGFNFGMFGRQPRETRTRTRNLISSGTCDVGAFIMISNGRWEYHDIVWGFKFWAWSLEFRAWGLGLL